LAFPLSASHSAMKPAPSRFRRILRICSVLSGAVVLLIALAFAAVYGISQARLNKVYSVEVRPVSIPNSPQAIAAGKHLATTRGCTECHGADYGGASVIDDPMVGQLHGSNITRGRGGLSQGFSDLDYVRAIRHGISPEGRPLVLMPSAEYSRLSDEDQGPAPGAPRFPHAQRSASGSPDAFIRSGKSAAQDACQHTEPLFFRPS
jgi:mono/diheme cytochrome c family protein